MSSRHSTAGVMGILLRLLSPVSIAPTVALVGLSLYGVAAPKAGTDWLLGGLTILFIITTSQILPRTRLEHTTFGRFCRLFPVLGSLVVIWFLAGCPALTRPRPDPVILPRS